MTPKGPIYYTTRQIADMLTADPDVPPADRRAPDGWTPLRALRWLKKGDAVFALVAPKPGERPTYVTTPARLRECFPEMFQHIMLHGDFDGDDL